MKLKQILILSLLLSPLNAVAESTPEPLSRLIESYKQATPVKRVPPKYPRSKVKRGQDGWVQLSFVIDEEGKVKDVVPIDHGGSGLFVKSAIRAVEQWQYEPATANGEAIEQCSNSVQLDFSLGNGAVVGKRFNSLFRKAQKASDEKDYQELSTIIEQMDALKSLNRTELFWRNFTSITLHRGLQQPKKTYLAVKRTLASSSVLETIRQGKDIIPMLLKEKFIYEAENELYAKALNTFKSIEKQVPSLVQNFQPFVEQINEIVKSDRLIAIDAEKSESGVWIHELARNQFAFNNLEGDIHKLEVRCDRKRSVFTFDINSSWQIPESWGQCTVFVDTANNTKFTLVEMNS
ncbi:MAG: energy transducer TonB [Gammaproteobacteria bacterium]|nr:energy transducer TonB [Gammaproteobacteria bacterium]